MFGDALSIQLALPPADCPIRLGAKCELVLLMQALEPGRLYSLDAPPSAQNGSVAAEFLAHAERGRLLHLGLGSALDRYYVRKVVY